MELELKKRRKKVPVLSLILILISVAAAGSSIVFYKMYRESRSESDDQQQIISAVSEIVEVPQEEPTMVTVADKSNLSNRQLAEKVNNGDVLLIYPQAKRLVVYRPSSSKVADMLSFQGQSPVEQDKDVKNTTP